MQKHLSKVFGVKIKHTGPGKLGIRSEDCVVSRPKPAHHLEGVVYGVTPIDDITYLTIKLVTLTLG